MRLAFVEGICCAARYPVCLVRHCALLPIGSSVVEFADDRSETAYPVQNRKRNCVSTPPKSDEELLVPILSRLSEIIEELVGDMRLIQKRLAKLERQYGTAGNE